MEEFLKKKNTRTQIWRAPKINKIDNIRYVVDIVLIAELTTEMRSDLERKIEEIKSDNEHDQTKKMFPITTSLEK